MNLTRIIVVIAIAFGTVGASAKVKTLADIDLPSMGVLKGEKIFASRERKLKQEQKAREVRARNASVAKKKRQLRNALERNPDLAGAKKSLLPQTASKAATVLLLYQDQQYQQAVALMQQAQQANSMKTMRSALSMLLGLKGQAVGNTYRLTDVYSMIGVCKLWMAKTDDDFAQAEPYFQRAQQLAGTGKRAQQLQLLGLFYHTWGKVRADLAMQERARTMLVSTSGQGALPAWLLKIINSI